MANYEGEIIENGLEFLAAADVFFAVFPDIIAKEIECDAPKPRFEGSFAFVAAELLEGCDEGFLGWVIRRGPIVDPRSEIATDPSLVLAHQFIEAIYVSRLAGKWLVCVLCLRSGLWHCNR